MTIDKQEDLDALLRAGRVVAEARQAMVEAVAPGATTGELDAVGREVFRRHGARSAPGSPTDFQALRVSASMMKRPMAFRL